MRKIPWERTSRIAEVREQIWSYVTPASRREGPGLLVASSLLGWPANDVAELGALQFLLSAEVRQFVEELPDVVRSLSVTSVWDEERSSERVRGTVRWGPTIAGRLTTGAPHLHVTAPIDRAYQTAENELLVHVLDAVVNLAAARGWHLPNMKSEPATVIRNYHIDGLRWQSSRMLATIERIPPTPRSLSRIAEGRAATRYQSALAAYWKLDALVERLDRAAIRTSIEEVGLVTAAEHILFELLTLFRVMDSLAAHGWRLHPLRLFRGAVETHGTRSDGRGINLWYQTTPTAVLGPVSRYRAILAHHGFPRPQDLRPDLVLQWQASTGATRTLMIECKLSTSGGVKDAARSALFDLLAYGHAFASSLSGAGSPYGLGVAWGAGLTPRLDEEVMLCTPDTIEEAMSTTVA